MNIFWWRTPIEVRVLKALKNIGGEASVLEIFKEIERTTGKEPNIGKLYVAVDRLEAGSKVETWHEPGGPTRGYRPKLIVRCIVEAA